MGDIVNLRQARKRAAREKREAKAADNRVAFGTPKAIRLTARHESERQAAFLDGVKRGGPRLVAGNAEVRTADTVTEIMQPCDET